MKDKAVDQMLDLLSRYFDNIFITRINYERAATTDELAKICIQLNLKYSIAVNPTKFVYEFKSREPDECLVVLGSMYLLGEIKTSLMG